MSIEPDRLVFRCECGETHPSVSALLEHTLRAHRRPPTVRERTPVVSTFSADRLSTLTAYVSREMNDRLDAAAADLGISKSALVIRLVNEGLEHLAQPTEERVGPLIYHTGDIRHEEAA